MSEQFYTNTQRWGRQKQLREYIQTVKRDNPELYEQWRLAIENEEAMKAQQEEARRVAEEARRLYVERTMRRVNVALVDVRVPLPAIEEPFVAFRMWATTPLGTLKGMGVGSWYDWEELNFAHRIPTAHNAYGLYAVKVDPIVLVRGFANHYLADVCGLVGLRGEIVEHGDGVLRAECARILCIWYTSSDPSVFVAVPNIMRSYPNVPVYVTSKAKVAEALFLCAARNAFLMGSE